MATTHANATPAVALLPITPELRGRSPYNGRLNAWPDCRKNLSDMGWLPCSNKAEGVCPHCQAPYCTTHAAQHVAACEPCNGQHEAGDNCERCDIGGDVECPF